MPPEAAFQTQACAAAGGTRASRMHGIRSVQLAGSPAVSSRPAEASLCLESHASTRTRVYHPQYARCGENLLHPKQAHTNTRPMPAFCPMLTDLAEAVRRTSASEQLAARVAGQAHRPVLLCTLHIGGANWKSRATCDPPVLPRSPTDPTPSGQRRCRIYRDHCCKLQAEAIRGCNLVQIAAITMLAHTPATGGGVPEQACCCQRDACIPYACHNERAACRLTRRRE